MPDNTKKNASLSMLFDLQKFTPNKRLKSLADAVGEKYGINSDCRELSDDELEVWAAGDPTSGYRSKKPEDDHE